MPKPIFNITIGPWCFKPTLKLSLLTLVLIISLVYLGCWQLHRAEEKRIFIQRLLDRVSLPPAPLHLVNSPSLTDHRFLPVEISGVFMNQFTFLLDNQIVDRQAGFRVLTPLQSPYLDKWLLIDRGWVPIGTTRTDLPEIAPVFGLQKITGTINTVATGITWTKDEVDHEAKYPLIIEDLDYNMLSKQMHHPIYNFVIQIKDDAKYSFIFPADNMEEKYNKHIGYALQWFTFAIMVFIYYIVTCTKKRTK